MAARDGSTIEQSIEIDLSSSEDEGEPPAPPQPPSPAEQADEPEHCHFAVRLKLQGLDATTRTKPHAKPRRRRGRPLTLRYENQRKRRKVAEAAEATVLAVEEGADDAAERMVTVTVDAAAVFFGPAAPNRTLALELSPAQANRASSSEPSTLRMVKAVQLPSREVGGEEVGAVRVLSPVEVDATPASPLLDVAPQAKVRRHVNRMIYGLATAPPRGPSARGAGPSSGGAPTTQPRHIPPLPPT